MKTLVIEVAIRAFYEGQNGFTAIPRQAILIEIGGDGPLSPIDISAPLAELRKMAEGLFVEPMPMEDVVDIVEEERWADDLVAQITANPDDNNNEEDQW
jgi:hypothetical protein